MNRERTNHYSKQEIQMHFTIESCIIWRDI